MEASTQLMNCRIPQYAILYGRKLNSELPRKNNPEAGNFRAAKTGPGGKSFGTWLSMAGLQAFSALLVLLICLQSIPDIRKLLHTSVPATANMTCCTADKGNPDQSCNCCCCGSEKPAADLVHFRCNCDAGIADFTMIIKKTPYTSTLSKSTVTLFTHHSEYATVDYLYNELLEDRRRAKPPRLLYG